MQPSRVNLEQKTSYALKALFFFFGLMLATWSTRIPDLFQSLNLNAELLATLLFTRGFSQVIFFPFATTILLRFGSKKAATFSGILIFSSFPLYAILSSGFSLGVLFFASGLLFSLFDIANNSMGAESERNSGKKVMTSLHAWFSIGVFAGATIGSQVILLNWSPFFHFVCVAILALSGFLWSIKYLPDAYNVVKSESNFWKNVLNPGTFALGVVLFFTATIESSLGNWTPLYFKESLSSEPHQAIWGYTAFNATMLTGRVAGDFLRARIDDILLAIFASVLAFLGFTSAVFASTLIGATIGFGIAGLGLSVMFPIILGQAAPAGAGSLASVATFGYIGGLFAPLLIGAAVSGYGYIASLYVFVVAAAILPTALLSFFFIQKRHA